MRIHRVLVTGALGSLLVGCLSSIVPLYQSEQTDGGVGLQADMAEVSGQDSGPAAMDDLAQGTPGADLAIDCVPRAAAVNDGHHNPGQNCLVCHNGLLAGAPKYFVAGTLYDSVAGTNPVAGASIELNQNGVKVQLQTGTNGNFYTETAVTFPLKTRATGCPDIKVMLGDVANAAQGSCNAAGCHDNATNRIHLP